MTGLKEANNSIVIVEDFDIPLSSNKYMSSDE
jgi:hypothetical protein